MDRRRRIALYGGSFDPVHAGHMEVARNLRELFALDEVLFIPAHLAPHKRGREVARAIHRYAMLALATQGDEGLRVSTIELDAPERPYTIETLSRLQLSFGAGVRLFFVMGADSWEEITTWREWERVLTSTDQLVVTRPGYALDAGHVTDEIRARIVDLRGAERERIEESLAGATDARIYLTDAARVDVASTGIRRAVREGDPVARLDEMVAPSVADYIRKYGLYREQSGNGAETSDAGIKREH